MKFQIYLIESSTKKIKAFTWIKKIYLHRKDVWRVTLNDLIQNSRYIPLSDVEVEIRDEENPQSIGSVLK